LLKVLILAFRFRQILYRINEAPEHQSTSCFHRFTELKAKAIH